MASRTIENDRDRKMTIMTTTFVPCGAKLPIIAMIAGAFFDNSGMGGYKCLLCRHCGNHLLRYYLKENKDVCR